MTPATALAQHRAFITEIGETVTVRRYTGTGPGRPTAEADIAARVTGYTPNQIVGAVVQGDRQVIALNDPSAIVAGGKVALATLLPLSVDDKLVIRGIECAILGIDDSTKRIAGVLIALMLHVRG